jgi:hypothetical protein
MDQAALRQALRCGDTGIISKLHTLVNKIIENPMEEKFRTLRLENNSIRELLMIPGAEKFLHSVGFSCSEEHPGILFMPAPSAETLQALTRERERIKYEHSSCCQRSQQASVPAPVVSQVPCSPSPEASQLVPTGKGPRLVVFDFDGTITIDSHVCDFGLAGERLNLLSNMADHLLASNTCTVLVTAQRILTTTYHTVPLLRNSGLDRLFRDHDLAVDATPDQMFYKNNPNQGAIYTGQEAWHKMPLIAKILAGDNRWKHSFHPMQVLYVDDSVEQLSGCKSLGINLLHVRQDGMNAEDIASVERFASQNN